MDTSRGHQESFFDEYQAISNKLKKRFLRKPNVAEASEEFGRLAARLRQRELPAYAGLCQLARARCQETLASRAGESEALLDAARCFLKAHREVVESGGADAGGHLQAAISLYNAAIRQQLEAQRGPLAARQCLELATALRGLGRTGQALLYYQDAADLQAPPGSLESRKLSAECQLELVELEEALSTLDDMRAAIDECCERPTAGACGDYLRWCEVCQLLLLLAMELPATRLKPTHSALLTRFSKLDARSGGHMSESLYLLLQSLSLAVRRRHLSALYALEGDLHPLLDDTQRHLLERLVRQVETLAPPEASHLETSC